MAATRVLKTLGSNPVWVRVPPPAHPSCRVVSIVTPTKGSIFAAPATRVTARSGQSDDLNGVRVADPYRWLENITAPEVRNWVLAQNAVTDALAESFTPLARIELVDDRKLSARLRAQFGLISSGPSNRRRPASVMRMSCVLK